jgi:hypothetical protein
MRSVIALALLFPALALADWGDFDFQYQQQKPWAEQPVTLPAYPKQKNLLPFFVSAATSNRFFIDEKSVTVGGDGVVHYTLVVKSPSGAFNVTFAGMRCATRSVKFYAFGRSDGSWSRARHPRWRRIVYRDRNRQEHVLFDDFFCPGGIAVGSPREALDALRHGYEQ